MGTMLKPRSWIQKTQRRNSVLGAVCNMIQYADGFSNHHDTEMLAESESETDGSTVVTKASAPILFEPSCWAYDSSVQRMYRAQAKNPRVIVFCVQHMGPSPKCEQSSWSPM